MNARDALGDALAWEASYQLWRERARAIADTHWNRTLWAEASLAVRARQAVRWLALTERERRRRRHTPWARGRRVD